MTLSSRLGVRRDQREAAAVAQQCPEHVDPPAGQGDQGLGVALSLGAFAVVEGSRQRAGVQARQRRQVEHPQQISAVAARSVQVAAAPARVVRDWCHAGIGGQVVGASDEIGAYPKDRPASASSVAATILQAIGVDLESDLPGPQSRPLPVVDRGVEPIKELFG